MRTDNRALPGAYLSVNNWVTRSSLWGSSMASVVRVGEEFPAAPAPLPWRHEEWAEKLPETIERGAEHLISLQAGEGYWLGELEADSTLESDYIYYLYVLNKFDPVRIEKLANY